MNPRHTEPADVLELEVRQDLASDSVKLEETPVKYSPASFSLCDKAVANRSSLGKRIMDYAIALPLVILLAPVYLVVFCLIKVVDSGPAFFVQEREGMDGKPLRLIKFRTMYVDADTRLKAYLAEHPAARVEWEKFFKLENDPRTLPFIGNFLRRSSLDELPNLLNVLRGDLSLVGPRPFPEYHIREFEHKFRFKRSSVYPGVTGLWQIHRGDLISQQQWDEEYIDNWSVSNDLWIFLMTVPAVLLSRKPKP